jgi:hypothetical protein
MIEDDKKEAERLTHLGKDTKMARAKSDEKEVLGSLALLLEHWKRNEAGACGRSPKGDQKL